MLGELAQVLARAYLFTEIQVQDFKIPKPEEAAQPIPVQPETSTTVLNSAISGPSTIVIMAGVGAALVAAILFFFLKGGLFNHLIEKRVPPSSARGASWAFYIFLVVTAWTAITGFVAGIWSSVPFLSGGGVLIIATLVFFLVTYSGALKRAR